MRIVESKRPSPETPNPKKGKPPGPGFNQRRSLPGQRATPTYHPRMTDDQLLFWFYLLLVINALLVVAYHTL